MTYDELLDRVTNRTELEDCWMALRKVVELHKPRKIDEAVCIRCSKAGFWIPYPCITIRVIEGELG
jgi:hypothetical protein